MSNFIIYNLTSNNISLDSDIARISLGPLGSSSVLPKDFIGNYSLCSQLSVYVGNSKVKVVNGSNVLTTSDLYSYAQGSDMIKEEYDTDNDLVVDYSEELYTAINSDITIYVDHLTGDDSNSGLSSEAPKKTLGFLYSGDDNAITREINGSITVSILSDIYMPNATRGVVMDGFYGSGSITLNGAETVLAGPFTATGIDLTHSNYTYGTYLEVAGETWDVDAYKGKFVKIGSKGYPIMSNTADRLEGVHFISSNFSIVSYSRIISESVDDPGTVVNYGVDFFNINECSIDIFVNKLDLDNFVYLFKNYGKELYFNGIVCPIIYSKYGSTFVTIENSFLNSQGTYASFFSIYSNNQYYFHSVILSSDVADNIGMMFTDCTLSSVILNDNRFFEGKIGIFAEGCSGSIHIGDDNLFEGFTTAIKAPHLKFNFGRGQLAGSYMHFYNNDLCMDLFDNDLTISNTFTLGSTSNTADILLSNSPNIYDSISTLNSNKPFSRLSNNSVYYYDSSTFAATSNSVSGYLESSVDTGTTVIDSFSDTIADACIWDYLISDGANNFTSGSVVAAWKSSDNTINSKVTTDLVATVGDTSDVTMSVDIDSNNVRFLATSVSDGWTVKAKRRSLF